MEAQDITDIQIRNILVPTDFSSCSEKALLFAINIARLHNAGLTLLHIVPRRFGASQQSRDAELRTAWSEMNQLQSTLCSQEALRDVCPKLLVIEGKDWRTVSNVLESDRIDLIVMGTHGKAGLKKLILGSFADTVFHRAKCPVLTVGPRVADGIVREHPRRIVFASDDSDASRTAAGYAFQVAQYPEARLTLLGMVHSGSLGPSKAECDMRLQQVKYRLESSGLYAACKERFTRPEVTVGIGAEVETILRTADVSQADLIILGLPRKGDRPEAFRTDAYSVVCSALCPVLTVRAGFPDAYFKRLLQMFPGKSAISIRELSESDERTMVTQDEFGC